jgi:SAM-dependent methyltransferase
MQEAMTAPFNQDLTPPMEMAVDQLYRHRFPETIRARRLAVWRTICEDWLQRCYIPSEARVLEVGAGYCEFINNIQAVERVAVDINPDVHQYAAPEVRVHRVAAEQLSTVLPAGHFDIAFMSNFLEHCRSRSQLLTVLNSVREVLRPGGRVMILGPNLKYCYREYYDYFDHYLPLTDQSLVEALHLEQYQVDVVVPRSLPFTFRSRLPSWPWLVRLYLRMPWAWNFFGAQYFLIGRKPTQGVQRMSQAA